MIVCTRPKAFGIISVIPNNKNCLAPILFFALQKRSVFSLFQITEEATSGGQMLVPACIASLLLSFTLGLVLLFFLQAHSLHTSAHTAIYSILFLLYRNTRARLILLVSLSVVGGPPTRGNTSLYYTDGTKYRIQRWIFFLPLLMDGFSRLTFTSTSKP